MNRSRRQFLETGAKFCAAALVRTSNATAADVSVPFQGEKTTWHEGFDRYDFMMDDATGAITPMTALASEVTSFDVSLKDGKRRCVVVAPKKAAPSNPWSWRGCYWDHQPQTEVDADNPALFDEDFAKIPELAKHDIPLLHVVGTEDFVLRHTMTVEKIYHQWGGSITVIMKEGVAHHPHSLIDRRRSRTGSSSICIRSRRTARRSPIQLTPRRTTTASKILTST